jgi:hypothetical protein
MVFDFANAPEGQRRITATVKDSAGQIATASITISIKDPHIAPTPVITWPPNGTTIPPGTYTVTGYAKSTDPGDLGNLGCSSLVWNGATSSTPLPGSDGNCEARLTLAAGLQQVTLAATGRYGDTGTTSVFVDVEPEAGLFVQILQPTEGSTTLVYNGNIQIAMSGNAAPIEAGWFVSYVWSWYLTSAGPGAKHIITVGGPDATWRTQDPQLCSPDRVSSQDVTIELYVEESSPSDPSQTKSGTSHVNIHLWCVVLR